MEMTPEELDLLEKKAMELSVTADAIVGIIRCIRKANKTAPVNSMKMEKEWKRILKHEPSIGRKR